MFVDRPALPCVRWRHLSRRNGEVEKQHRLNVGKLPVAYRTEPDGRWAQERERGAGGASAQRGSVQRPGAAAVHMRTSQRLPVCREGNGAANASSVNAPPCA